MNYALKAIFYLVGLLSSDILPAVPVSQPNNLMASSIMANHFSPQSTPIAPVADAQAARPTSRVV
jgi:hypothetical protein